MVDGLLNRVNMRTLTDLSIFFSDLSGLISNTESKLNNLEARLAKTEVANQEFRHGFMELESLLSVFDEQDWSDLRERANKKILDKQKIEDVLNSMKDTDSAEYQEAVSSGTAAPRQKVSGTAIQRDTYGNPF